MISRFQDKYILTSMAILCIVCVWHSVVPQIQDNERLAQTADRCALIIIGTFYVVFHLTFFLYIYFVVSIHMRRFNHYATGNIPGCDWVFDSVDNITVHVILTRFCSNSEANASKLLQNLVTYDSEWVMDNVLQNLCYEHSFLPVLKGLIEMGSCLSSFGYTFRSKITHSIFVVLCVSYLSNLSH